VAGITRYSIPKSFAYSACGLTLKYLGIVYATDALSGWLTGTP